ncbi:MAG: PP2C family protein-serine/threonine phosphatase [Telluria sp.]
MNSYKLEAGTAQHIGSRAQQNDRAALYTGARAPGYVLAVLADGMSAGPAGPEQVLLTAKTVFDQFKPGDHPSVERLAEVLREIVHDTHMIIKMNSVAAGAEQLSTFAALILSPHGDAVWAHVGDSRIYHFHRGECKARTSDAAYLEHLAASETLSPEDVRNYRHSKMLANLLGNSRKEPFVTIGSHSGLGAGDVFLLCSDGLWCFFTDLELGAVTWKDTPRQAAERLINKSQERAQGKGDNCTMAILKLAKPPEEPKTWKAEGIKRAV